MNYLDLLQETERKFVEKIKNGLMEHNEISSIAIVGSLAKGHYTEKSDIDILVLVQRDDFSLETCKSYSDELGFNAELKDDAYDFVFNGRNISLLFKDSEKFLENIKDIIDGKQLEMIFKPWAYGGMITDVLLLDVRNEIILADRDGRLKAYSERLKNGYPESLASAIMDYNTDFIKTRLKALNRFYDNPLMSEIIKSELMVSFTRYVYGKKNAFNPGLKHIFGKDNIEFLKKEMPELVEMMRCRDDIKELSDFINKCINRGE